MILVQMSERHYHKHRASSPSPVLALLKIGADSYNSGGKSYHGRIYDSVLDTSESLSHLTRKRKRRSRTSSLSSGDHSSTSHAKKKGRSYNASRSRSRSESSKLPHSKKAKKVKGIQKRHKKKHLKTRRRSSSSDDSSDESSSTSESQSSGDEIKKKRKHSHKEPKPSEHKRTKRLSKDSVHKSKKSKKEKHIIKYKRKLQTKKGKKFTDDSVDAASTTVAVGGAGLSIQTVDTKSASSVGAGSSRSVVSSSLCSLPFIDILSVGSIIIIII